MPAPPSSPPDEPALELLGTLLLKTEVCATIAATAMLLLLLLLLARHFDERNAYVLAPSSGCRAWLATDGSFVRLGAQEFIRLLTVDHHILMPFFVVPTTPTSRTQRLFTTYQVHGISAASHSTNHVVTPGA